MTKYDKVLHTAGLLINLGYLILMGIWFSRNPNNPTTPGAYSFFLAPILSYWCIRRQPLKVVAFIAGFPANLLNFVFLFVAVVGSSFSGLRISEMLLMLLFVPGNAILMLLSWISTRSGHAKAGLQPQANRQI